MNLISTDHAYKRAKERLGWNKKVLDKMRDKAFETGITHKETKSNLKKYISGLWKDHKFCNNVRIYGENIYFFAGETLITLYRLPNNLIKYLKLNS